MNFPLLERQRQEILTYEFSKVRELGKVLAIAQEEMRANPKPYSNLDSVNALVDSVTERLNQLDFTREALDKGLTQGREQVGKFSGIPKDSAFWDFTPFVPIDVLTEETHKYTDLIKNIGEDLKKAIYTEIKVGRVKGEPIQTTISRIVGTGLTGLVGADSVFRKPKVRAEIIARTVTNELYNRGSHLAYTQIDQEFPELALKKKWITTSDNRTSEVCTQLKGQVRELEENYNAKEWSGLLPPSHPQCRSRSISIPKPYDPKYEEKWSSKTYNKSGNKGGNKKVNPSGNRTSEDLDKPPSPLIKLDQYSTLEENFRRAKSVTDFYTGTNGEVNFKAMLKGIRLETLDPDNMSLEDLKNSGFFDPWLLRDLDEAPEDRAISEDFLRSALKAVSMSLYQLFSATKFGFSNRDDGGLDVDLDNKTIGLSKDNPSELFRGIGFIVELAVSDTAKEAIGEFTKTRTFDKTGITKENTYKTITGSIGEGLSYFSSPSKAKELYEKDPDLFLFTLGIIIESTRASTITAREYGKQENPNLDYFVNKGAKISKIYEDEDGNIIGDKLIKDLIPDIPFDPDQYPHTDAIYKHYEKQGKTNKDAITHIEDFHKMTNYYLGKFTLTYNQSSPDRSNSTLESYNVHIGNDSKKGKLRAVVFHELGHLLERDFTGAISRSAVEFLLKRAKDGELKTVAAIMGFRFIDKDEIAYVGDYFRAYVGRKYPDLSTEVISMGMERLSSAESIETFSSEDREHFNLMLGIVHELRGAGETLKNPEVKKSNQEGKRESNLLGKAWEILNTKLFYEADLKG